MPVPLPPAVSVLRPGSPWPICAYSALQREAGFPVTQESLPLGMLPASPWHVSIPRGDALGLRGTVMHPQGEGAQAGRHRAGWAPELSPQCSASAINSDGAFFPSLTTCPSVPTSPPHPRHQSSPFAPPPPAQTETHLWRVGYSVSPSKGGQAKVQETSRVSFQGSCSDKGFPAGFEQLEARHRVRNAAPKQHHRSSHQHPALHPLDFLCTKPRLQQGFPSGSFPSRTLPQGHGSSACTS